MLPSSTVWQRPHLLDNYIRAQFADVLNPATRDEYSREERAEALIYVKQLAALRHESAADILADLNR